MNRTNLKVIDEGNQFGECPECGRHIAYRLGVQGQECPHCKYKPGQLEKKAAAKKNEPSIKMSDKVTKILIDSGFTNSEIAKVVPDLDV